MSLPVIRTVFSSIFRYPQPCGLNGLSRPLLMPFPGQHFSVSVLHNLFDNVTKILNQRLEDVFLNKLFFLFTLCQKPQALLCHSCFFSECIYPNMALNNQKKK